MNIFKSFRFSLAKKVAGADPKKSAPAPANKTSAPTGSGSATLHSIAVLNVCRRHIKIPQHVEVKHNTFEVADLQKLIKKTTNDLEVRQSADFTTCVCFLRAEAHCFVKK